MLFSVKNTAFPGLLDLLAPHSCRGCGRIGSPLCHRCKNYITNSPCHICPNCKQPVATKASLGASIASTPSAISTTTATTRMAPTPCPNCPNLPPIYAVNARTGLLDDIIRAYKYQSIRALATPLAELLDRTLPQNLGAHPIITPLPTATHHIRARGFDHTALLARHLAKLRNYKVSPLLLRAKNTVQVGANEKARTTQAAEAYALNPKIAPDPITTYILLDDIWTTGASIKSAINLLHSANIKNDHIVVALLAYSID